MGTSKFSNSLHLGKRPRAGFDFSNAADAFIAELVTIYGANILFLWLGDDMIFTAGLLTSWPARIGSTLLPSGVPVVTPISIGGRSAGRNTIGGVTNVRLTTAGATTSQSEIAVLKNDVLPFGTFAGACLYEVPAAVDREVFTGSAATNNWFTGGWTHLRNGVATEGVDLNWHTYEANRVGVLPINFPCVFGSVTVGRNWLGSIAFRMILQTTSSPAQRAASLPIINTYYGGLT